MERLAQALVSLQTWWQPVLQHLASRPQSWLSSSQSGIFEQGERKETKPPPPKAAQTPSSQMLSGIEAFDSAQGWQWVNAASSLA